jgi:hypothetical protein
VAARRGATLGVFLRAHLRGARSRRERRAPPPAIGAGATNSISVARDGDDDTRTRHRRPSDIGHLCGFGCWYPIAHSSETLQPNRNPTAQRHGDTSRRNADQMKGEEHDRPHCIAPRVRWLSLRTRRLSPGLRRTRRRTGRGPLTGTSRCETGGSHVIVARLPIGQRRECPDIAKIVQRAAQRDHPTGVLARPRSYTSSFLGAIPAFRTALGCQSRRDASAGSRRARRDPGTQR